MKLTQAMGNTWYLEGAEDIPLYQLDETRCILLDCGLKIEREDLFATLEAHHLTPVGMLGTHEHLDHTGNAFALREQYGTRLALPSGEAAIAAHPDILRHFYGSMDPQAFWNRYGHLIGQMDQTVPEDAREVEFCGVTFGVLRTPGHSPDHVCYVTPDGVCCLGDALYTHDFLAASKLPYHGDHLQAIAQMERLAETDYPLYLCAHKGPVTDLAALAAENKEVFYRIGDEIASLIDGAMEFDQIAAKALWERKLLSSKLDRAAIFARNVRRYLDQLIGRGIVKIELQNGMICYRKA